jgi:CBS domain-containing protein
MSAPAFTVTPDRLGGEVLFELLERGYRHAPVVTAGGRLVGVVEDADLFGVQPRSWFGMRRAIARAETVEQLSRHARGLAQIVLDLHASNLRALEIARVLSALTDAVAARALELSCAAAPLPADGIVWVALGSHARRELTPACTPRGALVCSEPPPAAWSRSAGAALAACGLPRETGTRSPRAWREAAATDALARAVLVDRRALFGTPREPLPLADGDRRPGVLAALAADALAAAVPTGFDAGAVLAAGGGRSGRLDIAAAALEPIVAIARWASAKAGLAEGSTPERLRAGADAGTLSAADANNLTDAFELAFELRVAHQLELLAADRPPDDLLAPAALSPLARDHLRDVFRAIAGVQRGLDV